MAEINDTFWFCETLHIIAHSDIWVLWESLVEIQEGLFSSAFFQCYKKNLGWGPPPLPKHIIYMMCYSVVTMNPVHA